MLRRATTPAVRHREPDNTLEVPVDDESWLWKRNNAVSIFVAKLNNDESR